MRYRMSYLWTNSICKNTGLGKEYDYASNSYTTFAERFPISTYEEFQPLIERTQRGTKYILTLLNGLQNQAERLMPKANLFQ
jgi:hypothetical protein